MGRKRKTQEDFIKELNIISPNIKVLGKYKTSSDKIKVGCLNCGHIWDAYPINLLQGRGCRLCANKIISDRKSKTTNEFKKEVFDLVGNEYTVLGEYKKSNIKILMRHNCDECNNNEFLVEPSNFLSGVRCKNHRRINQMSQNDFIVNVHKINPNIEVLGNFTNVDVPVKCKCLIHDYIWYPTYSNLKKYKRCPVCNNSVRLTHDEFINKMHIINPNIIILSEFKIQKEKVKCKCLIDGYEWSATPDSLLHGEGCKKCSSSKGEKEVNKILQKYSQYFDVQYKFNDCRDKKPLPFDFAVFTNANKTKLKFIIEYDGELHYQVHRFIKDKNIALQKLKSCQKHDKIKNQYCKEHNIKLIRIPYWNFNNIENIISKELDIERR